MVNKVFSKVNYPNDIKAIKHIVEEYDKKLDHFLGIEDSNKSGKYMVYMIYMLIIVYVIKCSWVSLFTRSLYIIPCAISIIYNIILLLQVKNDKDNKKLHYKSKTFEIIFICIFIYSGTFIIESILFGRNWTDKDYLIWLCRLAIFCLLSLIIARINAPKRFIKDFQYKESKLYTPSSILTSTISLLVCIAYFNKPYYIILMGSYILLIVMSGLMAYIFFVYRQYDKIQELKKELNYESKEK